MTFYNSAKSINYKHKYYAISYKLSFIANIRFIKCNDKYVINHNITYNDHQFNKIRLKRFIFDKLIYFGTKDNLKREYHLFYNKLHRNGDKPAKLLFNYFGDIIRMCYYKHGIRHRDDNKVSQLWVEDVLGFVNYAKFHVNGKLHRIDAPAVIICDAGVLITEAYYQDNKLHRLKKPAVINYSNGFVEFKKYYQNGKLHRLKKPAAIRYHPYTNLVKDEKYYQDGILHNEDGPAKIQYDMQGNIISSSNYLYGFKCEMGDTDDDIIII